jgi:pilus assembly protein CpaC
MRPSRVTPYCGTLLLVAAAGLLLVTAVPAGAAAPSVEPAKVASLSESLAVYVRQACVVNAPWPIKRVSITDPAIADVQVLSPRQVLVQGKQVGSTTLLLWSEDEKAQQMRIDVEIDLSRMLAELKKAFPLSTLEVTQSAGVLTVRGRLARVEEETELKKYLDATGAKYVNMTTVAGTQQVLLQVRLAEVSRTAVRQLGINVFKGGDHFFGASTVGPDSGGAINPLNISAAGILGDTAISPTISLLAGFPNSDLTFFIQALAENQYLRVLAEPNLVALSGEEATFLAGGEYPIPVIQGTSGGAGGGNSITIEYKKFGVQLRFRPVVLGDGSIRLLVAPEVSELSSQGAVTLQGFQIPSLLTRQVETTLELKSGQTFCMAGLINRSVNARTSRVPGLGDLPVLGALFRSVRYVNGETELVVLVAPNDWELYAKGRIAGRAAPVLSESDVAWLKKLGLGSLKGPSPWETYGQPATGSRATARPAPVAPAAEASKAPVAAPPAKTPSTK